MANSKSKGRKAAKKKAGTFKGHGGGHTKPSAGVKKGFNSPPRPPGFDWAHWRSYVSPTVPTEPRA